MFYISSLPPDAQKIGKAIRQHWSIENQLHWVLDVTFNEDDSRIRTKNAPLNFALLKRWSINFINKTFCSYCGSNYDRKRYSSCPGCGGKE